MSEKETLEKLRAMKKWESLDKRMKEDRVWEKLDEASQEELEPVLKRNKKWREDSMRSDVVFY